MRRKAKLVGITATAIGMVCAGFVLGCLCTQHWVLGVSYGRAIHSMYHEILDDSYRF